MNDNSVLWKEGMLLLPQHFQCQELHFNDQLFLSAKLGQPYYYGFSALELDEHAIQNWRVSITVAQGRTKEGSLFSCSNERIPPLKLRDLEGSAKDALESGKSLTCYFAIRKLKINGANFGDDSGHFRFNVTKKQIADIESEGDFQTVEFKSMRPFITTDASCPNDFEYLPLCRLNLDESGSPSFDKHYFPTMVNLSGSQNSRRFVESMMEELEQFVGKIVSGHNDSQSTNADFVAIQIQTQLASFISWVHVTHQCSGVFPFDCYLEIYRLITTLSILREKTNLRKDFEVYDHDRVYSSLDNAWSKLCQLLETPDSHIKQVSSDADKDVDRIPLVAVGGEVGLLRAEIPKVYFSEDWELYLGFDTKWGNMAELTREQRELFFGQHLNSDKVYHKFGAEDEIDLYFESNSRGVLPTRIQRKKRNLPREGGWYYGDFERSDSWDAVENAGTLCLKIDEKSLAKPLDNETITVGIDGETFQYRVSVFAVRKK